MSFLRASSHPQMINCHSRNQTSFLKQLHCSIETSFGKIQSTLFFILLSMNRRRLRFPDSLRERQVCHTCHMPVALDFSVIEFRKYFYDFQELFVGLSSWPCGPEEQTTSVTSHPRVQLIRLCVLTCTLVFTMLFN